MMLQRLNGAASRLPSTTALLLSGTCALTLGALCFGALSGSTYRTHADVEILGRAAPGPVTRITPEAARAAARLLLNEGVSPPSPPLLDRLAVGLGRAKAEDGETRLVASLVKGGMVAGDRPDRLQVWFEGRSSDRARRYADALAEGVTASENRVAAHWRLARAQEAATRVRTLESEAGAAHARLAALGVPSHDASVARAADGARLAELRARLDMIRAILASGTPPLADRRDVPPGIEGLQNNYLDLQRQLLKARQTLGDRHITIINLQSDLRKASADLSAEWQRLKRVTEAQIKAVRDEQVRGGVESPAPTADAAEIAVARQIADVADRKLTEAIEAQQALASPGATYRLAAPAGPPVHAPVHGLGLRLLVSGLVAGVLFFVLRLGVSGGATILGWRGFGQGRTPNETTVDDAIPHHEMRREPGELEQTEHVSPFAALHRDMLDADAPVPTSFWAEDARTKPDARRVLIATTKAGVATLPYALGTAYAAMKLGLRVLLIETERDVSTMAAMAAGGAETTLYAFDEHRRAVTLAAQGDGQLFVSPHGSGAIEESYVPASDDPLPEARTVFDLIIIDAGFCEAGGVSAWRADAYQRVGHDAADAADAGFALIFGADPDQLLDPILVPAAEPVTRTEAAARRMGSSRTRRGFTPGLRRPGMSRRTASGQR